jgi:L-2-hydroxyglutarate oxidase LhgO
MGNPVADFVVLGAGIVGLAVARELKRRDPAARIVVLEKEPGLAAHASGRNSGVIHSGIYYPEGSLKARVCAEGGRRLAAYCDEHGLPIARVGKVIVPVRPDDAPRLEALQARGRANGAPFELIGTDDLRRIEPDAGSADGRALYRPDAAVIESGAVVECLARELTAGGVEIRLGTAGAVLPGTPQVIAGADRLGYGHLVNAAGAHADRVAHALGVGERYRILPFRGMYHRLRRDAAVRVNGLIYPVPDLRFPFLGVHCTRALSGTVYLGPTAVPALGRENYRGLQNLSPADVVAIAGRLLQQYVANTNGFRRYLHQEAPRLLRPAFLSAVRALLPRLRGGDVESADKVGIRAQLYDRERGALEMDFVIEPGPRSTHVLNAVSPALTCALSFAEMVVDEVVKRET